MPRWVDSTRGKETITINGDEEFRVVDDPSGTPVSGKVTVNALKNYISTSINDEYLTEAEAAALYLTETVADGLYAPIDSPRFTTDASVNTTTPRAQFAVAGTSIAYTGVLSGDGLVRFTTGTGANIDEALTFGVHDGDYAWIQASKPGTAARSLYVQPVGGNVAVGSPVARAGFNATGASYAYTGAISGDGTVRFTTGTGQQTDESLIFGIHDGDYCWIQATKPGTGARDLKLQPIGGRVMIEGDFASDTRFLVFEPGATTRAVGSGMAFFMNDVTNYNKTGIFMEIHDTSTAGTITTNGIEVNIFTPPDNGGDASGIYCKQTGGGNAITCYNISADRPGGFTDYPANGNAIEAGVDGTKVAISVFAADSYCVLAEQRGIGGGYMTRPSADTTLTRRAFAIQNAAGSVEKGYFTYAGVGYLATSLGVGTASQRAIVDITGPSQAVSSALAGDSLLRLTTGTGAQTDETLNIGIHDSDYAWMQASKPGTAARIFALQPNGGGVAINQTTVTSTYTLDVNGTIRATSLTSTSDATLKDKVSDLGGARAFLHEIVNRGGDWAFRWKDRPDDKRVHMGLSAQIVKEAADKAGVEFGGYQDGPVKGLDYSELIAPLIRMLVDLDREFQAYKAAHP